MRMYYLVYLPSLMVAMVSQNKEDCEKAYAELGRDYDEDYRVMEDFEFVKTIARCMSEKTTLNDLLYKVEASSGGIYVRVLTHNERVHAGHQWAYRYVTDGYTTNDIKYAKAFATIAEAEEWINNHKVI